MIKAGLKFLVLRTHSGRAVNLIAKPGHPLPKISQSEKGGKVEVLWSGEGTPRISINSIVIGENQPVVPWPALLPVGTHEILVELVVSDAVADSRQITVEVTP